MNYIEQELLRQQAVLRMLLQGQTDAEETDRQPASPSGGKTEESSEVSSNPLQRQLSRRSAVNRQAIQNRLSNIPAGQAWSVQEGTQAAQEGIQTMRGRTQAARAEARAVPGNTGAAEEVSRVEAQSLLLGGMAGHSSSTLSAAVLSHAVERDARRYDGAFLLY